MHAVVTGLSPAADTDAIVRGLVDIEEIKQLKARYFRFLDTRRWDEWAQIFTVDCEFRTLPDSEEVQTGREDFAAFVRSVITPGVSVHHGHMPETALTGPDTAEGVWAMTDYVEATEGAAFPMTLEGYGHYHETYRREPEGWRISSLQLTRLRVDDVAPPA